MIGLARGGPTCFTFTTKRTALDQACQIEVSDDAHAPDLHRGSALARARPARRPVRVVGSGPVDQ
jgi:hypothetical protein